MSTAHQILSELNALADPDKAVQLQRFFKTGSGEYGEGDRFMGIRVPESRLRARKHRELALPELDRLLASSWHEARLTALLIMVLQARSADEGRMKELYEFYLSHTDRINNWDLVDTSAEHIVGAWLFPRSRKPLHRLARSNSLWERRIAIMATFHFIKRDDFGETLALAERLGQDREDLIHKAVGWMLREVGNRDRTVEEAFLRPCYQALPRTLLRYAIEKFPEELRKRYLKGEV